MTRTAVVALGGNALLAQGEKGTYEQQRTNAAAMAVSICALLEAGWRVVVVHGNGPQVGNLAIQQELGRGEVPAMPLFSLGAMTEGQLGSLIAIALYGVCGRRHRIAALLSHVIVDLDDPAFERPTKPIGPFFSEEAATRLAETRGWDITEDAGRGFRRVVASPLPRGFVEIEAISSLLDAGHVVVTGGGGGIPVGRRGDVWDGVDAVIDKDRTSALMANVLHIDDLMILTAVPRVAINFGKPNQKALDHVTLSAIRKLHAEGHFPPGSMGPKIDAAIQFLEGGGKRVMIGRLEDAVPVLRGESGTHIIAD